MKNFTRVHIQVGNDNIPEVTIVPLIRPDVPQTGVVYGDKWGTILSITLNTDVLAATGGFDSPL